MTVVVVPSATPFESAYYVGINLQDILYGVELVLYFKTMRIFLARRRKRQRSDFFYAAFSTTTFLLITGWVTADVVFGHQVWLSRRHYPGGPMAYMLGPNAHWYNTLDAVTTIILQQMTDGLMVYRCRLVWNSRRACIVPLFMWLSTIVLGCLGAATQGTDPQDGISVLFVFAYFSVSVLLSATLTCMICYRIWCHAKKVEAHLGREFASPYFGAAMLLVESALPYTLAGIVFLVTFGVKSQMGIASSRVYTLMMCVSPQMLILRVAEEGAWQTDARVVPASGLTFSPSFGGASSVSHLDADGLEAATAAAVKRIRRLPSVYSPESEEDLNKV